ncbi:MAG: HD domain-containing protein [Clostridiales bacterium]|jgi:HD-GYP domain-containing protein (c-di-GMP phosphodiesterase class II)|nr:HD domain-containing protein [Clostridiales bacterium]
MDQLIRAITMALDIVESGLLGASTNHGKRIGVLCAEMGRRFGMDDYAITSLVSCALFHDSALTEYILSERDQNDPAMLLHCEYGERNAQAMLPGRDIAGFVLYHHERADGLGPYGKKSGEFPLEAELIAIADMLDVACHLQNVPARDLPAIRERVAGDAGVAYTRRAAEAMLAVLDTGMLEKLRDGAIGETVDSTIPAWTAEIDDECVFGVAGMTARIIDYKSEFTKRHSTQIANKAWLMGERCGYSKEHKMRLYLSAALHDLGKLAVPSEILEKPGSLTSEEFAVIKAHSVLTHDLLKDISGFGAICEIATSHHEKLNGSGYPFQKGVDELSFDERLLACLDIYQAVSEPRPYHPGRSHAETMPILNDMAEKELIDGGIVADLDIALAEYSGADAPPPPGALA